MATGIVRFYNDVKGFGIITPDTGGAPIFAHAAQLKGVKKLSPRQRVEYDVVESAQGTTACNIRMGD